MNNNYSEIYKTGKLFFKKIMFLYKSNEYDYVILTTRRCFCLFFALYNDVKFIEKFDPKEKEMLSKIVESIISSQKIKIVGNLFNNKKVLLLDDVMIHGHAVYRIYKSINSYNPQKIDTLVAIRNIEIPDFYFNSVGEKYYSVEEMLSADWRKLSNSIVKYLHFRGQCYTSYIYGIKTKQSKLNDIQSLSEIKIDFKELETYSEFGQYPVYYSWDLYTQFNFIQSALIRKYQLPDDNENCLIVPYIQLSDFETIKLDIIWNELMESIAEKACELSYIKTTEDKYKALTAICSICLYKKLFGSVETYNNIIDKSFVPDFLKIIAENFNIKEVFSIIEKHFNVTENSLPKTLMKVSFTTALENSFEDNSDIYNFLKTYFYIVTRDEDKAYQEHTDYYDYLKPIFASDFNYLLNNNFDNINKNIVCAILMFLADIGVLSYISVADKVGRVGSCIKTGEQSYHLFINIAKHSYKAVYVVLSHISRIKNNEDKNEFITEFKRKLQSSKISFLDQQRILFLINYPPIDLSESYFGVLDEKEASIGKSVKEKTNEVLFETLELLKN